MKTLLISLAITVSAASLAFAQDRPRYYDNFDTKRGVQVASTPAPTATPRPASSHYLPSPPHGDRYKRLVAAGPGEPVPLVQKTGKSMMRPSEAYSARETSRPQPTSAVTMAAGKHLRGYSTGDTYIDALIVESSRRYSIDPLLIYSQMHQESSFKLRAKSYKGASGLMQLMPATARRLGVTDIYDPKQNIDGGVKYMRMLLNMFDGDVSLALAGYNAGEGAVMKYGYQIPPYNETRDYVKRISARYRSISGGISKPQAEERGDVSQVRRVNIAGPSVVKLPDGRTRLEGR